jgi:hypothetical protein
VAGKFGRNWLVGTLILYGCIASDATAENAGSSIGALKRLNVEDFSGFFSACIPMRNSRDAMEAVFPLRVPPMPEPVSSLHFRWGQPHDQRNSAD